MHRWRICCRSAPRSNRPLPVSQRGIRLVACAQDRFVHIDTAARPQQSTRCRHGTSTYRRSHRVHFPRGRTADVLVRLPVIWALLCARVEAWHYSLTGNSWNSPGPYGVHRHQFRVSWNLLPRRIVQGSGTLINRRRSGRIRMLRQFTRDIDDADRYLMSRTLVKGRFG